MSDTGSEPKSIGGTKLKSRKRMDKEWITHSKEDEKAQTYSSYTPPPRKKAEWKPAQQADDEMPSSAYEQAPTGYDAPAKPTSPEHNMPFRTKHETPDAASPKADKKNKKRGSKTKRRSLGKQRASDASASSNVGPGAGPHRGIASLLPPGDSDHFIDDNDSIPTITPSIMSFHNTVAGDGAQHLLMKGFEDVEDIGKMRHKGLLKIVSDATDEELVELMHVGASKCRFWPLQLPTLAPLVRALKDYAGARLIDMKKNSNPARRGSGMKDHDRADILRNRPPIRSKSRLMSGSSTPQSWSSRSTPMASDAESVTSDMMKEKSMFVENYCAQSFHVAEFGKAKSLSVVPLDHIRILDPDADTKDSRSPSAKGEEFSVPSPVTKKKKAVLMTDSKGFRHGNQVNVEFIDMGVRNCLDGFDKDLKNHISGRKKGWGARLDPARHSHFWQKLIFHVLVIGICVFYGVYTMAYAYGKDTILDDSCMPFVVIARCSALGTCIWTTVLFLTMNRRVMSLIGSIGPARGRWSSWMFDGSISFHKHAGYSLIIDAAIHVFCHAICTLPTITGADAAELNNLLKCGNLENAEQGYMINPATFRYMAWPACPFVDGIYGLDFWASWTGVTGILMVASLIFLGYTVRPALRKRNWELFAYFHGFLIFAWPIMLFFHGVNQWIGVGLPLVFFSVIYPWVSYLLLDCIPRALHTLESKKLRVKCAVVHTGHSEDVVKNGIVSLFFDVPELFGMYRGGWRPGQLAYVRVPAISKWQWHPFTIASGSNGQLRFCIQAVGNWTSDLVKLCLDSPNAIQMANSNTSIDAKIADMLPDVDNPISDLFTSCLGAEVEDLEDTGVLEKYVALRFPDLTISVDGPYRAPTITAIDPIFKETGAIVILVASGIGVTPFIAMLDGVIEEILDDQTREMHPDTQIHLYWMTRRVDDFLLALPALRKIADSEALQKHIKMHLHLTSLPEGSMDNNAVFLFRWGITLHNQQLRQRLHNSELPVPVPWLYPKPLDMLGLRYLVEAGKYDDPNEVIPDPADIAKSAESEEHSIFDGVDAADVQHAVVLGRPDFGFEINLMGGLHPLMPIHVYCCANQRVQDSLERVVDTCNDRDKSKFGRGSERFFFKYERFGD